MIARALADASPTALFALSRDMRLLAVNSAFETLTGLAQVDAAGRPLRSILTPTSQILYALKVEPALLTAGAVQEILVDVARPDGRAAANLLTIGAAGDDDAHHGVLFAAPERRAYEFELIAARKAADAAAAARDLLLREVYHRVKNNLQTVDSLLLLQAKRLRDPDAIAALQMMRRRVFALGLVHHQLMGSSDLRTFDVAAFLQDLARHLMGAGEDGLQVEVVASSLPVGLDFAIPLGLIVTELVSHAAAPAGADADGVVCVELGPDGDDHLRLRVSTTGVQPVGDPEAEAFGLLIVRGLAGQLGGVPASRADARIVDILMPRPGGA